VFRLLDDKFLYIQEPLDFFFFFLMGVLVKILHHLIQAMLALWFQVNNPRLLGVTSAARISEPHHAVPHPLSLGNKGPHFAIIATLWYVRSDWRRPLIEANVPLIERLADCIRFPLRGRCRSAESRARIKIESLLKFVCPRSVRSDRLSPLKWIAMAVKRTPHSGGLKEERPMAAECVFAFGKL